MVIILKKKLEKKGAEDVTSKSTDLGSVSGYFLHLFASLASPPKCHCQTECSEVLSAELCGCCKLEIRGVYVVITDYWIILAASYHQRGLCLLVLNPLFQFSQNDNRAFWFHSAKQL